MESDFSDTIKGPMGTLNEPVGKRGCNNSLKAVKVQKHKTATVDLDFTTPALAGGMVPGTSLEL